MTSQVQSVDKTKVSVVVPCYEEAPNIKPLCTRLFAATKKADLDAELLLVDDYSGKGTEDSLKIVESLKKEDYNIRIHVRKPEEGKGLSSAVLLGLELAKNDILVVMDADLQHEPESVPSLVEPVMKGEAEFCIGCRYIPGGKIENWSLFRKIVSIGATLLARPLTPVSDPMSGFFCVPKKTLERGQGKINPLGFKIGLEIMVRCHCKRIKEVPITFRNREEGESKLTKMQYIYYLLHLANLYWYSYPKLVVLALCFGLLVMYLFIVFVSDTLIQ